MISVIIPVYNVEAYLHRCIDSVLEQTYQDLEIILVDDGSTDSSGEMCDEYMEANSRIRVIHKANGGLSSARNAGLKEATGKYIAFIDSDDSIDKSFFSVLMKEMEKFNADVVECGRVDIFDNNMPSNLEEANVQSVLYTRNEAMSELIDNRLFRQTVWNKLYTRDAIGNLIFEEGKIHEDEFFTWQVFCKNDKFVRVDEKLYHYYHRQGSIMESGFSMARRFIIEARLQRHFYIEKHMPHLKVKSKINVAYICIFLLQRCLKTRDRELISQFQPLVVQAFKRIDLNIEEIKEIRSGARLFMYLSKISLPLCARLRNLLGRHG